MSRRTTNAALAVGAGPALEVPPEARAIAGRAAEAAAEACEEARAVTPRDAAAAAGDAAAGDAAAASADERRVAIGGETAPAIPRASRK